MVSQGMLVGSTPLWSIHDAPVTLTVAGGVSYANKHAFLT